MGEDGEAALMDIDGILFNALAELSRVSDSLRADHITLRKPSMQQPKKKMPSLNSLRSNHLLRDFKGTEDQRAWALYLAEQAEMAINHNPPEEPWGDDERYEVEYRPYDPRDIPPAEAFEVWSQYLRKGDLSDEARGEVLDYLREIFDAVENPMDLTDFWDEVRPTTDEVAEDVTDEAVEEIGAERVVWNPDPDTPLKLAQVVCLPELGGRLYVGGDGEPGPNISEKTLRAAIDRGQLRYLKPTKNIFVTKSMLMEWLKGCPEKPATPASLNESPASTRTENSLTKALGSSSTQASKLRQDAVSLMLAKLR